MKILTGILFLFNMCLNSGPLNLKTSSPALTQRNVILNLFFWDVTLNPSPVSSVSHLAGDTVTSSSRFINFIELSAAPLFLMSMRVKPH